MPRQLAKALGDAIHFGVKVEYLARETEDRQPHALWRIRPGDGPEIDGNAIVLAVLTYEAARLASPMSPALGELLSSVSYAPMAVVSSGYARSQVRNALLGFGFMVPRRESLNTFLNVLNSSLLPGRAPKGKILITSFAGGARNPSFVDKDDAMIAQIVEDEVGPVLGIEGSPLERFVWKIPRALPQFTVGHARRVASIQQTLAGLPGLYLSGNYFAGRSIGECVETANVTAADVARRLNA